MPLKLYKRPNGVWHIRGTVQRIRYDQSARTRVKAEAEAIRAKLEADAFKRAIYGDRAVATFAEAAADYMRAGGSSDHMTALLLEIGPKRLSDIKQPLVDRLARDMKPDAKASTLIRQIYTPISAVINYAAEQDMCDPIRLRKPRVEQGRVDYLTPAEAETLLNILPTDLQRLVTFYLATGCRATEALMLDWRDVSPEGKRAVFWETKGGYARGVDLQRRARAFLPKRAEGPVFPRWADYDAVNKALNRATEANKFRHVHCHLFRHTWATWAYACTRDITFLMQQGGWKSATMVTRYAHAASPDLADAILGAGWEFGGREVVDLSKVRAKSRRSA